MKYFFLFLSVVVFSCEQTSPSKRVPKIIFDTDFGGDADDLGALAMLNHFQNRGECDLVAVMCWNTESYSVAAVSAVNGFYGNPDIPIGTRKVEGEHVPWNHSKVIADNFSYKVDKESAPESTSLYRKLLANAQKSELVIVTVGPLANIMNLINSGPDEYSSLSGKDLIQEKVKEFVIMGGQFPTGEKEWNFDGAMPGVTKYVIENLDVPIVYSGYEVGVDIKSGEIFNTLPENHPVYKGFLHFSEYCPWLNDQWQGKIYDNATYDQTAVLYAVRGGLGEYWERVEGGVCVADSVGGNTWALAEGSNESYLTLLKSNEEMAQVIETFMMGEF